jgi:hypothetical protein
MRREHLGSMYSNPANLAQFCTPSSPRGCGRGFNSSPPEAYRTTQYWQDLNRFTGGITFKYNPVSWMSNRVTVGTDYVSEYDNQSPVSPNDTPRSSPGHSSTATGSRATIRRTTTRMNTPARRTSASVRR